MFASAWRALGVIFHPAFRGVLLKSLLLTIGLFAALFFAARYGLTLVPAFQWHWLNTAVDVLGYLVLVAAMVVLGAPVAALFASLFLDDIAKAVEKTSYPADAPSVGIPFWPGLRAATRLTLIVVAATVLLLPFDIELPGVGEAATLLVNGWIMGREFFELAALRHLTPAEASDMRRRHAGSIWLGGLGLSLLSAVPLVNLFAPLYGAAFMVHLFKRYAHQDRLA